MSPLTAFSSTTKPSLKYASTASYKWWSEVTPESRSSSESRIMTGPSMACGILIQTVTATTYVGYFFSVKWMRTQRGWPVLAVSNTAAHLLCMCCVVDMLHNMIRRVSPMHSTRMSQVETPCLVSVEVLPIRHATAVVHRSSLELVHRSRGTAPEFVMRPVSVRVLTQAMTFPAVDYRWQGSKKTVAGRGGEEHATSRACIPIGFFTNQISSRPCTRCETLMASVICNTCTWAGILSTWLEASQGSSQVESLVLDGNQNRIVSPFTA